MATGVKEAKLIDDEPTNGGLVQVTSFYEICKFLSSFLKLAAQV